MAFILPNLSPPILQPTKSSKEKQPFIHQYRTALLSSPSSQNNTRIGSSLFALSPPVLQDAQVKSPPGAQDKHHHEKDEFYVNLGLAVRTLREDMSLLFTRDLNYDIYRDDITFVDPLNTFTGIDNYKLIFWALRFHGKILFRDISLEVFRIWQPSENVILIRWNLRGVPRVPWEAKGEFQGTSWYKLDRNGKIYEHKVDNLAFNFPQQLKPAVSVLDLVASSYPPSPNPTFLWGPVEDLYSSSWLQFYRAVRETLDTRGCMLVHDGLATCS
ncbi:hypothetical protein HS088_TW21G00267 [Tripterygium wilfordii]|uniref:NTF2-like domain-containing protein n=1 Tax=Tripterygium wilfordii TaxID=458696 RepID=A0A7J7C1U7_TRIWF|nr:uncharacterized protein LOC119988471 [Tripterygium wilfordii]KAF5728124.1 hypothetical protein HS088_TW21G00267 [Tripterygium wilfordii]